MKFVPFEIISTLYPVLVESARYAALIQSRIHALEEKEGTNNIFAAALSDADLGIQTHVELSLLAHFPEVPFFGEEWKSSRNTKYLIANNFHPASPYLVTLDPIDGTRPYLDGHKLYQIILAVVSREAFEGVIVLYPTYGDYVYALRGKGAFRGSFETALDKAEPLRKGTPPCKVYLAGQYSAGVPKLEGPFEKVYCSGHYSATNEIPYVSAIPRGELCGGLLFESQVIDGAALAFVAQEMGFIVQTFEGAPIPKPGDYPSLVLPGLVIGDTHETVAGLLALSRAFPHS